MRNIDNREDIMDSRDFQERIDELKEEREALVTAVEDVQNNLTDAESDSEAPESSINALEAALRDAEGTLEEWDASSEAGELKTLEAFKEEVAGYCEWDDGATIVRDSYFEDFARDEAEQLELIKPDARWPNNHIDWEAAAAELQSDYTSGEFGGVVYWVRTS